MMRVYISGGMSGRDKDEYRAHFRAAEVLLKEEGYKVFNPCKWAWFLKYLPYRFALAFDIFILGFCDRIFMLEGWSLSGGARAENQFALTSGIIVMFEK